MGRHFRIRVRGKPRQYLDPDLLAQAVILYGRQLARQREQEVDQEHMAGTSGVKDGSSNEDSSISDNEIARSAPVTGDSEPSRFESGESDE